MVESVSRTEDEKLERKRLKKLRRQQAALAEASQPPEPAMPGPNVNGSTLGPTADAEGEAKTHKKKKKRKQQPDSTSSAPLTVSEEQKSKKEKRKQPQEATASNAAAVQDATNGVPIEKQSADASMVPDQAAAAPTEGVKPKKKKSTPAGASDSAMWAAVGNQEAARAGRPVQKALYTEDPAVTCMTDAAVQQWRDERQTAITGCNIKPVTAFSQAGEHSAVF